MDGVPVLKPVVNQEEWYVQPVAGDGITPLELDAEGELINPELATEVEFGRLNIVRSPQSVLDQALNEAMKVLDGENAVITLDFCGRLTSTYGPADARIVKTIDSPRESMAIYQHIMRYMFTAENRLGTILADFDQMMIAASCFAAGSDKTGTVDKDEVVYINGFMDCYGYNPILNAHEYDFNHELKQYFNFSNYDKLGKIFTYNRQETYENRYVRFLVWDGKYYAPDDETLAEERTHSILDVMEGKVDNISRFTQMFNGEKFRVEGFAIAIDDAVQVLDFVHGDSNIIFVPDWEP